MMVYARLSALLLLLALTHCYIWTRKKPDGHDASPSIGKTRRRVKAGSKYAKQSTQISEEAPSFQTRVQVFLNGDWINGVNVTLSSEECVGTIALSEIIAAKAGYNGNCSLYTFYGRRIRTCEQAMIRTSETGKVVMNDLFIVPEGRFFMLPAREIGEVMYMNHIVNKDKVIIQLEVLSVEPRIFKVRHFLTAKEASGLIANAKDVTSQGHRLQRTMIDHIDATEGSDIVREIDEFHTSDSAFDHTSAISRDLQIRLFEVLGMSPYQPPLSDGIQVSRYNVAGAYKPHMDYFDPTTTNTNKKTSASNSNPTLKNATIETTTNGRYVDEHDYDSGNTGHNRYATLLLYLSDVPAGGETVFSSLDPVYSSVTMRSEAYLKAKKEQEQAELALREAEEVELIEQALAQPGATLESVDMDLIQSLLDARNTQRAAEAYLQQHNATHLLPPGTWEHDLVGTCRTHLHVKPKVTEGILFYSQDTFGRVDERVVRGSCPVLQGELWTARLHIWNGPMNGYWARDTATNEIIEKRFIGAAKKDNNFGRSTVDATTAVDGSVSTTTSVSANKKVSNNNIKTTKKIPQEIAVTFKCVDVEGATLFWEDQVWELLVPGRVLQVNSYYGHKWHIERNNVRLLSWVIQKEAVFEISSKTLGQKARKDEL